MTGEQSPLRGSAWAKAARAALSAQARARRIRGTTYTRKADRLAGAQYVPGGNRRMPPPPAGDGGEKP